MVIHDADCLQERVCDHRADKADAPFLHVLAHGNRNIRNCRHFRRRLPMAIYLLPVFSASEAPEIFVEGTKLRPDLLNHLRVLSHAVYLVLIPDDSGI